MILDSAVITLAHVPLWRKKLGILDPEEIRAALALKVNEGDRRLSDARPPLDHRHPSGDIDFPPPAPAPGPGVPGAPGGDQINYDNLLLDQRGNLLTFKGNVLWRPQV